MRALQATGALNVIKRMSNESSNDQSCTWCHGRGYITRRTNFTTVTKARWILVIGFTGFLSTLAALGDLHGWWAISAIVLVALAFFIQFLLELAEVKQLIVGQKVACPRCSRTSTGVS
jgi:hypothetical protein